MSETQTMADVSDERLAQTIADVDAPGINIPDWLREHLRRALTELQARRAAEAKAVEVDLPDYLRFGEPDMFPPAQK